MLEIKNLHARVEEKEILRGINLTVRPGEVHAIMGPNGSGKSTLASVLAGREDYEVTEGSVEFLGEELLEWSPMSERTTASSSPSNIPSKSPASATSTSSAAPSTPSVRLAAKKKWTPCPS